MNGTPQAQTIDRDAVIALADMWSERLGLDPYEDSAEWPCREVFFGPRSAPPALRNSRIRARKCYWATQVCAASTSRSRSSPTHSAIRRELCGPRLSASAARRATKPRRCVASAESIRRRDPLPVPPRSSCNVGPRDRARRRRQSARARASRSKPAALLAPRTIAQEMTIGADR